MSEPVKRRVPVEEAIQRVEELLTMLNEVAEFRHELAQEEKSPGYSPQLRLWLVSVLDNRVAEITHTIKVLMEPLREL